MIKLKPNVFAALLISIGLIDFLTLFLLYKRTKLPITTIDIIAALMVSLSLSTLVYFTLKNDGFKLINALILFILILVVSFIWLYFIRWSNTNIFKRN